jgi:hypothetical protein
VLDDPNSFTLQEIVSLGETERRLKLSEDNIKLIAVNEDASSFYKT